MQWRVHHTQVSISSCLRQLAGIPRQWSANYLKYIPLLTSDLWQHPANKRIRGGVFLGWWGMSMVNLWSLFNRRSARLTEYSPTRVKGGRWCVWPAVGACCAPPAGMRAYPTMLLFCATFLNSWCIYMAVFRDTCDVISVHYGAGRDRVSPPRACPYTGPQGYVLGNPHPAPV